MTPVRRFVATIRATDWSGQLRLPRNPWLIQDRRAPVFDFAVWSAPGQTAKLLRRAVGMAAAHLGDCRTGGDIRSAELKAVERLRANTSPVKAHLSADRGAASRQDKRSARTGNRRRRRRRGGKGGGRALGVREAFLALLLVFDLLAALGRCVVPCGPTEESKAEPTTGERPQHAPPGDLRPHHSAQVIERFVLH